MKIEARKESVKILRKIDVEGSFSHLTLNDALSNPELSDMDRRFIMSIVYGVLENKLLLDYYIRKLSTLRFGKINHEIVIILRMGLYQLIFMDRVPDSAAVNESVKLAKKIGNRYGGFVNGILRAFIRMQKTIELPDRKRHLSTHLSILYSHPEWLVEKWLKAYGATFTEALLSANNSVPELWVRVNTLKTDSDTLIKDLAEEGVDSHSATILPDALQIKASHSQRIETLKAYKSGLFSVQDISSMSVGAISGVQPGDFVIDVCAAPGGKSTHMAQLMSNKGRILARDISPQKIGLIQENSERLGIDILEVQVFDAMKYDDTLTGTADVVLVDAPCSGFGIIRRKPDIKYNKSEADLQALTEIQFKILETASEYVKPGGVLIYSTCTINDEENGAIVHEFLRHHPQYVLTPVSGVPGVTEEGTVQLFPNVHASDGFFIAKMTRRNN
ncbi:16S rRNA (cytosine(967)-C(5))-methyltransferase RsmB [Fusibacter tunisiensis]|uniref:16S rRNA (cytosine(967)-C(5))-methyltransferase n=1 Tax=Fusibacter tunisiensis TaxID=1008308 RepID=A0ABS2MMD0_9FIRM|nr:16S rRNA (cytosine(967)-C(5))-methyltransferase RsmB [Fusibacter tunisiensis]MBM7560539.1 16S rRNA (cytosine967-C5)-methyltransferase [Fusibacter tunisiensis]